VPRDRAESPRDRIVETQTDRAEQTLFRVAGVEPHGWSTVLIEDGGGRFYIASTTTGHLTEVGADEANRLIQNRTYRRWHGDRSWTVYERLPLVAQSHARQYTAQDPSDGESTI
jgi:hypothetical protein